MSRKTEKAMKQVMEYLDEHNASELSMEEVKKLLNQYVANQHNLPEEPADDTPCADDYMDLAERASSKKKKLEYLNKALELEPDNLDVSLMIAIVQSKSILNYLEALSALAEKGEKLMKEGGFFKDSTGDFWMVLETRPYMRVLSALFDTLIGCNMLKAAAFEGQHMLKLCKTDNLGIRYRLMHVYATLEDEASAKILFKRYNEDLASMLLPLCVLYFKLRKFDIAEDYLTRLSESNKGTKKFIHSLAKGSFDKLPEAESPYGYQPGTIEEFCTVFAEEKAFYITNLTFFEWADSVLNRKKQ